MKDHGGPAFPRPYSGTQNQAFGPQGGMTLRDYFAAQVVAGFSRFFGKRPWSASFIAEVMSSLTWPQ